MKPVRVVYQKKPDSPHRITRRKTFRCYSPTFVNDYSSKCFQIQTNTPMFQKSYIHNAGPSPVLSSPVQKTKPKPKRKIVSYIPSSSLYNKLNAKLTLNTLEFDYQILKEHRLWTKTSFKKTIDYTNKKRKNIALFPLEARGSSLINEL